MGRAGIPDRHLNAGGARLMAEVVNIDGQANARSYVREFLESRLADVRDDPPTGVVPRAGYYPGWTALCPCCECDTRIRISRDLCIEPCPNGHTAKQITDAMRPPTTGIGTLAVELTPARIRAEPPRREYLF